MIPPPYAAPSVVPAGDVYSPPMATQLASTGASSISQLLLLAALLIATGIALYVTTKARPRVR
jgi:LPXTG-motif cell wall-anchored protein